MSDGMKRYHWLGITLFIILFALARATRSAAQTGTIDPGRVRYFPETGHTLSGDFLFAYEKIANPELIYGHPITEPFQDESSGRLFQYFEKARFELVPENPPELKVTITPLGYLTHDNTSEFPAMGSIPGCRYFSEYGKSVCYDFLGFFNAHGGVAQFGYPLTNFALEDGWIVQYFQRARFEWHPELPSGQKVRLTDLGKKYFWMKGEDPRRLISTPIVIDSDIIDHDQPITELAVRASMKNATTHATGDQTVFITVQDQKLAPVESAQIALEITLPSGDNLGKGVTLITDKNGIASYSFSFSEQPPGLITVRVRADKDGLRKETVTFSLVWW